MAETKYEPGGGVPDAPTSEFQEKYLGVLTQLMERLKGLEDGQAATMEQGRVNQARFENLDRERLAEQTGYQDKLLALQERNAAANEKLAAAMESIALSLRKRS